MNHYGECSSVSAIDFSQAVNLESIQNTLRRHDISSIDLSGATKLRYIKDSFKSGPLRSAIIPGGIFIEEGSLYGGNGGNDQSCPNGYFCSPAIIVNCSGPPDCYLDFLLENEDELQSFYLLVAGPSLLTAFLLAYLCGTCCFKCSDLGLHRFAWLGVALRLGDMLSDLFFNIGSLGMISMLRGEEFGGGRPLEPWITGQRFDYMYDGDARMVVFVSAISLLLGVLLTGFDVWGYWSRVRRSNTKKGCCCSCCCCSPRVITLLITLFEDLPQLSINCIYINACGISAGASAVFAIVALTFSVLDILINLVTLRYDFGHQRNKIERTSGKDGNLNTTDKVVNHTPTTMNPTFGQDYEL